MDTDGQPIDEDTRSALRFFAYWIANMTLIINLIPDDAEEPDYLAAIADEPALLGQLFAAHLAEEFGGEDAAAWLLARMTAPEPPPVPCLPPEAPGWMQVVVEFADDLAHDRLEGCPQPSRLLFCNGGSPLEAVFAVLGNVLRIDGAGQPLNAARARERAAELARVWLEPGYRPAEPFRRAETELV